MGCKEELTQVSALVDELGSLGPVKAPGDLLEKIHERMDLGYGFHRIVRKLFVPFRIKIPLEFAGAVVVAILVVAVFLNIQQTEEKIAKIPKISTQETGALKPPVDHLEPVMKQEAKMAAPVLEESPPAAPGKARVPALKQKAKMPATLFQKNLEERSRIEEGWVAQKSMEAQMKSAVPEEIEPSPAVSKKRKAGESGPAHEPIELALVLKKELIAGTPLYQMELKSELRDVPDTSAEEEVRTPIPYSERELVSMLGERVKLLIGWAKGKVLAVKYERQTGRLHSIHAEIPAARYESFTEGLRRLGTLRTTPPALSEKDRETIHIRINLESSE
jgi:cell division protein FtsN